MRKWIFTAVVSVFVIGVATLWLASRPVILAAGASMENVVFDGSGEAYRDLGAFNVTTWKYRQWFQQKDFVTLSGCIVADQPRTKIRLRGIRPSGRSKVTWTAGVGVAQTDGKEATPKATISIEYDLARMTATLLKTGASLPLSSDQVFTVRLGADFKPQSFDAISYRGKPPQAHPKIGEYFAKLAAAKDKVVKVMDTRLPESQQSPF